MFNRLRISPDVESAAHFLRAAEPSAQALLPRHSSEVSPKGETRHVGCTMGEHSTMSEGIDISATNETRPSRRRLIQVAAWLSFAPAALILAWDLLRYLVPPRRHATLRKVFVVRTPDLPAEDLHEMVDLTGRPLAIVRRPGGSPLAISLVCTHLGCRVRWQSKPRTFLCPCHMGIFDEQGRVLSGPPPAPLPQHRVSVEGENVFVHLPEI